MSIIEHIFRVIAPHHCVGCGNEGRVLCSNCALTLPAAPTITTQPPLKRARAVTTYNGLSKELIHRLKFERASAAADDIAALIVQKIELPTDAVVTYVPTAPARVRTRGYDQAYLIARAVARRTGLPCTPLLARARTDRQVGKDRHARQQQMKQAFYTSKPQHAAGRRIILVDDVLTTGSTCQAAAEALAQAGAEHVEAVVFAAA